MANQGFAEVWIKITGERIHCSPIPIGIGMLKSKELWLFPICTVIPSEQIVTLIKTVMLIIFSYY